MPIDPSSDRDSLTLDELTEAMHRFVAAKGWYAPDSPRKQSPRNIATSLVIEAAEVLEHFQWNGDVEDPEALAGELADVALYLLQLASLTGIDLQSAILQKLATNYRRSWD
ncbi:MAG: nucleotide pyrophosphohydrolase [Anaerolineae bacterium]